jgi:hypothetical protein
VLGPALPDFVREANCSFWREYFKSEEVGEPFVVRENGKVIRRLHNLVAKKTHLLNMGPLHAYYDGNLVKGDMCDACALSRRMVQGLRQRGPDTISIELEEELDPQKIHPAQMLHQAIGHAHFRMYTFGDLLFTGLLEQIKDIVEGEQVYYMYASPKEAKDYFERRRQIIILAPKAQKNEKILSARKGETRQAPRPLGWRATAEA